MILLGAGIWCGCHDHGTEHVRTNPWPVGRSDWTGWWGEDPPFHHPVFVLTHHPHPSIEMQGGTTFYFVDSGIEATLSAAFEAAGGRDVLVGGGAATVRQYLRASRIDEIHLAIVPVLLGAGERLFDDLGPSASSYRCIEHVCSPAVTPRSPRTDRLRCRRRTATPRESTGLNEALRVQS